MNVLKRSLVVASMILCGFSSRQGSSQGDEIEFACMKVQKSTNTCHFNFKIDGEKFRYTDIGCKYSKKSDQLLKKVKEGTLALAKDWKIECPAAKEIIEKKEGF